MDILFFIWCSVGNWYLYRHRKDLWHANMAASMFALAISAMLGPLCYWVGLVDETS